MENLKNFVKAILSVCLFSVFSIFLFSSCQLKARYDLENSVKEYNKTLPQSALDGLVTVSSCKYNDGTVTLSYIVDPKIIKVSKLKIHKDVLHENAKITLCINRDITEVLKMIKEAGSTLEIVYRDKTSGESVSVEFDSYDIAEIMENARNVTSLTILKSMVSTSNLQCPMAVDEITTLSSISLGQNNLYYNYYLDDSNIDIFVFSQFRPGNFEYESFKQELIKNLLNNELSQSLVKLCVENNLGIIYRYKGIKTGFGFEITITPDEVRGM